MKEKRIKFTKFAVLSRVVGRFGWINKTANELNEIRQKPVNWTVGDQSNLYRVADALESIARELKKLNERQTSDANP